MTIPPVDDLVFAAVLLVGFPVADYLVIKKLKRAAQPSRRFYAWTLGSEWLLTSAALGLLLRHGSTLATLGEGLGRPGVTLGITVAGVILVAVLAARNRRRVAQLSPEQLSRVLRRASPLVPQPGAERAWFVMVALTAGFCEELLYRGWLWRFFVDLTGSLWIAVLLSAVAFGLGHAYQGRTGAVTAGIAGLLFSVPVLLAHSLVPMQIIHAAIDLANGLLLSQAAEASLRARASQSRG